jgi:siderophore synthetase component
MHKSRLAISPIPEILPGTYDFANPLIRFAEVPIDKIVIRGSFKETIEKITQSMPSPPPPPSNNTILVPIHENQIPNIRSKFPFINILPEKYSIRAKSQASLRTMVLPNFNDIAIKLALGIKVTSALRTVTPWTVHSGTALGKVLDKLNIDPNLLKVCKEFAGIYSTEKNYDVAKHLSCIIREDFNELNSDGETVIICAALTERDEFGKSIVEKVWNLDSEQKRIDFFERWVI